MERFDTLASEYLDGSLSPAEAQELAALLEADPERRRAFADLVRQGRALARVLDSRPPEDFARGVMKEIEENGGPFVAGVMGEIRSSARPRRRPGWTAAGLAAAVAGALVIWATVRVPGSAELLQTGPGVAVVRGGVTVPARPGAVLHNGDRVRSAGTGGAVIGYAGEETRLEIEAGTELRILSEGGRKVIELARGEIRARVAPQPSGRPMLIRAPHARAEVLGTRLKLSATDEATRLEVEEGRVRLVREEDGRSVIVPPRHFTLAGPEAGLDPEPVPPSPAVPPRIVGFSLIHLDAPRRPIPGFEDLRDGAVLSLSRLPTRRINLQVHTDPPHVGSVRFAYRGRDNFNTELIRPYTLVPNDGRRGPVWNPEPGPHSVTVTPFTGTYGNGIRGESRTLRFTVTE
ncbi:MAG TPA: FecR domain-containing protein [Planctomycetota bacterium]|nr:FecR domain-containing protein [Planctomycetota bacterium]